MSPSPTIWSISDRKKKGKKGRRLQRPSRQVSAGGSVLERSRMTKKEKRGGGKRRRRGRAAPRRGEEKRRKEGGERKKGRMKPFPFPTFFSSPSTNCSIAGNLRKKEKKSPAPILPHTPFCNFSGSRRSCHARL